MKIKWIKTAFVMSNSADVFVKSYVKNTYGNLDTRAFLC